jgi:hypothetical protein
MKPPYYIVGEKIRLPVGAERTSLTCTRHYAMRLQARS